MNHGKKETAATVAIVPEQAAPRQNGLAGK